MTVLPDYRSPAIVISIVALSVTPLVLLFFRVYYRGLDFLQMCYLFAISMASTAFSSQLTTAMIAFNRTFFTTCTAGDFVCSQGFPLSFASVMIGILLVTFIFVAIQKCCGKAIDYEPVFLTFKGFIKWIYVPLAYSSAAYVLVYLNLATIVLSDLLLPAIVLGILVLFPFCQLIAYKCIQTEQTYSWRKWMQFLGYLRLLSTSALVACYMHYGDQTYLHCVMIMLIIYFLLYLWKGEFKYPVLERIIFFLGDAVLLTLFFIFKYHNEYITAYDLDFFGVAGVMALDFLLYLVRGGKLFCYGQSEGTSEVHPEPVGQDSSPRVKKNKYEHDSGEQLQNSRQGGSIAQLNVKSNIKRRR